MTSRSSLKVATFTFEGKRFYCYGKTKALAREKAAAKKALLEAGVREVSGLMSVEAWSRRWLADYKEGVVSSSWLAAMDGILRNAILPVIGSRMVKDVRPADVARVLSSVSDRSESYVKKVFLILRQMFEAAEDNGLILRDPTRRARASFRAPVERRALSPFERDLALRTAARFPEDGRFFLIMLYCGCRPQEVAVLLRSDFDIEHRVLRISKALKADGEVGPPKSRAGVRDIPIPDALLPYIPDVAPGELVCRNLHGGALTKTSIRNLWRRFRREMEIEAGTRVFRNALVDPVLPADLSPYCFRHTYCTDLQDAGVPLVVASRLMGHSDIKMTAKIYSHASDVSFYDALEKINKK